MAAALVFVDAGAVLFLNIENWKEIIAVSSPTSQINLIIYRKKTTLPFKVKFVQSASSFARIVLTQNSNSFYKISPIQPLQEIVLALTNRHRLLATHR